MIQAFVDGEILTLSCDKLLAESVDIPEIVTILNATPTCSYVRAGQRAMRSARIFKGDTVRGRPRKKWAYVFDALPANWQHSMAAPVLYAEFLLKDLYRMNGAEPPLRTRGPAQPPVSEKKGGYRILWDVQTLLSVGAMMERKRAIARAEVVPEDFLNDSRAVNHITMEHGKLPPQGRKLISGIYQEWEAAYKSVTQRKTTGSEETVSRYKYALPSSLFRIANNRLYLHRDAIPTIWVETQSFKTVHGLTALILKQDFYLYRSDVNSAREKNPVLSRRILRSRQLFRSAQTC